VADDLFAFRAPPPLVPPGASPMLGAILLAIDMATSLDELHAWSSDHDNLPHLLRPAERRIAIAALHRRETTLQSPPNTRLDTAPVRQSLD